MHFWWNLMRAMNCILHNPWKKNDFQLQTKMQILNSILFLPPHPFLQPVLHAQPHLKKKDLSWALHLKSLKQNSKASPLKPQKKMVNRLFHVRHLSKLNPILTCQIQRFQIFNRTCSGNHVNKKPLDLFFQAWLSFLSARLFLLQFLPLLAVTCSINKFSSKV